MYFCYFRSSKKSDQTNKMSSFLDLPNELILKVLSYTETADILSCGQVSKRIRTVSNDKSLFQTVNLSGKYVKTDLIEIVLNKGCKSLNLSDSFIWGNDLNLVQKSQLRKLDLSNCCVLCSDLEELFESCQYLKNLSLISLQLTPKMVANICQNSQTLQVVTSKKWGSYRISPPLNKLVLKRLLDL